ncbi:type I toxin-antitoxin system Ibs family toxin, partial [Escherichia coli]
VIILIVLLLISFPAY